jgi:hypothetical protein
MMKLNKWTLGLAAVGLVTLPATMQAEEKLSALQTALSSTTISGYVDTSAQWTIGNAKHYTDGAPPGFAFNGVNKQDGFNLNVVNLTIERPMDEKENWAAGYKVDMIYGPNAVGYNTSFVNNGQNNSDFGLKQAYVALRAPVGNGIDFKMGTFDSILGYEVFHSGNNPNFTRSYAYTFEPTQFTGLLASYQFCKEFGMAAGIANTANAGINNRSFLGTAKSETDKTYMAAFTLTAPDSMGFLAGSTLYGAVVNGFNTSTTTATDGTTVYPVGNGMTWLYAGATLNTPLKGLKTGVCYDYIAGHSGQNFGGKEYDLGTTWFNAFSVYLSYQATEKLSLHARAEYMWMTEGMAAALGGVVKDPMTGEVSLGHSGLADKIFALTGTVQYDLWANVLSRIEFRWDHAADGTHPFNDSDRNAFLLSANIIYKF